MKKYLRTLTLLIVLLLSISSAAFAANTKLANVIDEAGLLSSHEVEQLRARAEQISDEYNCDVYLIIVEDYADYSDGDVRDCAEELFTSYDLGRGQTRDGIMLLMSMSEPDYALIDHGNFANAAFTDYGKDVLTDSFLDNFRENDWYGGFSDYLENSAAFMYEAKNGTPIDIDSDSSYAYGGSYSSAGRSSGEKFALIFLLPMVLSAIVCIIFASQMKTAKPRNEADCYVGSGDVSLRLKQDLYTHTTVSRTPLPKKSSSGGTSINSGGFSGKSGKF